MATLRDQTMPFMFEVFSESGALVERYVLPINPEEYRLQYRPKVGVTQTRGGGWEDSFGNGLPTISIRGTFGYLGSLPDGGGRSVGGVQLCGQALFKELERIFLEFHDRFGPQGDAGTRAQKPTLCFYNFTDEHYYVIQVSTFDLMRSVQRRHLYQYAFQMIGLAPLGGSAGSGDVEVEEDPLQEALAEVPEPPVEELSFWRQALEGYRWASGLVSDAINYMDDLIADLTTIGQAVTSFRQGITDLIEAPFELVETAFSTVDAILGAVESLGDIPHEFRVQMRETKRTLCRYRIARALFREPPDPSIALAEGAADQSSPEIATVALPRSGVAEALGITTMQNPETTLFSPIETVADVAMGEVVATDNDTLQTLAHAYLGDPAAWGRLALLNDLEAPYELTAGQRIRIPGSPVGGNSVLDRTVTGTTEDWSGKAYGADEMLDASGAHTPSGSGGVETVSGMENLAMQLQHRLSTMRGELTEVGHPRYGCLLPTFIGKTATDFWAERAKAEAMVALLEDPRVAAVYNLTFTEQNGNVWIEGDVRPVNRVSPERVRLLVG